MVERSGGSEPYVGNTAGAPPVPPPGGYRGASRQITEWREASSAAEAEAAALAGPAAPAPKRAPAGWFAWATLGLAAVFALTLLGLLLWGSGTQPFFGLNLGLLQLVVLALVLAAVVARRSRRVGIIALALTLLVNTMTVGSLSAINAAAAGDYSELKSHQQRLWEAYPGRKDTPAKEVLAQPSLEELRAEAELIAGEVRTALSEEHGLTWAEPGEERLRPARNGYGGESMLQDFSAAGWGTNEAVSDLATKRAVIATVDRVIAAHGLSRLGGLNEPSSGLDEDTLTRFFGSADPATQAEWQYYSDTHRSPLTLYVTIMDLTNDPSGRFRKQQEANQAKYGSPLEGVSIDFSARGVLSEDRLAAFKQALRPYNDA